MNYEEAERNFFRDHSEGDWIPFPDERPDTTHIPGTYTSISEYVWYITTKGEIGIGAYKEIEEEGIRVYEWVNPLEDPYGRKQSSIYGVVTAWKPMKDMFRPKPEDDSTGGLKTLKTYVPCRASDEKKLHDMMFGKKQ